MSQQNHTLLLQRLCRLCAQEIILGRIYVNAKPCLEFQDVIRTCHALNVCEEDKSTYPKNLCSNCVRR